MLMSLTPCVARPITLKLTTAIRMIIPERLMIIRSSLSETSLMAIKFPVFDVMFIVLTPFSSPIGDTIIFKFRFFPVSILRNYQNILVNILQTYHADDFILFVG